MITREDLDIVLRTLKRAEALLREAWEETEHFSPNLENKIRKQLGIDPCDCENCIREAP